jgi:hypothetical protein
LLPVVQLRRAFAAVLIGACAMTLSKVANTTGEIGYAAAATVAKVVSRN